MDVSKWELVSCTSDTPQQKNGFDCGVYVLLHYLHMDCALVFDQSQIDQCGDRIALLSIMKNCAINCSQATKSTMNTITAATATTTTVTITASAPIHQQIRRAYRASSSNIRL